MNISVFELLVRQNKIFVNLGFGELWMGNFESFPTFYG